MLISCVMWKENKKEKVLVYFACTISILTQQGKYFMLAFNCNSI